MLTQMQSNYVRKMVFNANHVTDTLFCQDNLKFSKKLRKAPVLPNRNDDIILIYDSTVFGSAKEVFSNLFAKQNCAVCGKECGTLHRSKLLIGRNSKYSYFVFCQ